MVLNMLCLNHKHKFLLFQLQKTINGGFLGDETDSDKERIDIIYGFFLIHICLQYYLISLTIRVRNNM